MRFWQDAWCAREPLRVQFPSCNDLAEDQWGSVKAHWIRSRVFYSWNIQPRRNLNDWEIGEMGWLLEVLEGYEQGNIDLHDVYVWSLDVGKGFSIKTMYNALCPPN